MYWRNMMTPSDVLFLDTETTLNNVGDDKIGTMSASPFHPDNEIVWVGCKYQDQANVSMMKTSIVLATEAKLMVAQNAAFDLHYLLNGVTKDEWKEWTREGKIWDTMIVEYLLTGQQAKFINLDKLSIKYGGTVKDSRMKEYWEAGICTSLIPDEEIMPYLEGDVANLQIIYEGQLKAAKAKGMLALIESQMEARLATILMEHNGMAFDKKQAIIERDLMIEQYVYLEHAVKLQMERLSQGAFTHDECEPTSTQKLSALFFGGKITVVRKEESISEEGEVIRFKSGSKKGKIKMKNVKVELTLPSLIPPTGDKGKNGFYAVGEKVLKAFPSAYRDIAQKILKLREYKKQISTYFDGYSSLVFPDGMIHGTLNHCKTNTGRLSSSKPNLQNISNKTTVDL